MKKTSALLAYFGLAFGIAWTGVLLVATKTGLPALPETPPGNRLLAFLAMLAGPSLASVSLTARSSGLRGLRELFAGLGRIRGGARWCLALLIAPGLLGLTLGVLSLVSPAYVPPILLGAPAATVVPLALVGGLGAGFFEELGWTGFVTPRLLERYSWTRAGLPFGLVWAAWHGLADYWGGASYGSLWAPHMLEWFVALAAFRMLMTWVYVHARSLLLGMLLHASFTGTQLLLWPAVHVDQELLWYGMFACSLWAAVGVVVLGERRVARPLRGGKRRSEAMA